MQAFSGFAFIDATHRFGCVWPPDARGAVAELDAGEIFEFTEVTAAATAARDRVVLVGLSLLRELSDALRTGNALRWTAVVGLPDLRLYGRRSCSSALSTCS